MSSTHAWSMVIAFGVGILTGYAVRHLMGDPEFDNQTIVLLIVSIGWFVSVLADITLETYETPVAVHALAGAIVGFFFKPEHKS